MNRHQYKYKKKQTYGWGLLWPLEHRIVCKEAHSTSPSAQRASWTSLPATMLYLLSIFLVIQNRTYVLTTCKRSNALTLIHWLPLTHAAISNLSLDRRRGTAVSPWAVPQRLLRARPRPQQTVGFVTRRLTDVTWLICSVIDPNATGAGELGESLCGRKAGPPDGILAVWIIPPPVHFSGNNNNSLWPLISFCLTVLQLTWRTR